MKLDLHVHSTASDGARPPSEVVAHAVRGGLDVIALADHDTVSGVQEAREEARAHTIQVIPAIELSSNTHDREIHILGYFVDPASEALAEYQKRAGEGRAERMQEMVDRLTRAGVEVTMDDVLSANEVAPATMGRPHLARALVLRGHVNSVPEAFERFIGDGMPAHVPTSLIDPGSAIDLVERAGGIPVWAHPPVELLDDLLTGLVNAGLRGLEVYRPKARPDQILTLERAAREVGLMMSGGSDWHTEEFGAALGDFYVTSDEVAKLLEAGGM